VSRIVSVRELGEELRRPRGFDLATYWDRWSREFEERRSSVEVAVRNRRGDETTVAFEDLDVAYAELLRRGGDIEVLEPSELRDRLAATARELAATYAGMDGRRTDC
jgi:predicted DNA-binding transcriptional regulator YafY